MQKNILLRPQELLMNKIYGYCRISTPKQNIERQIRNILKEFPDAIIIQETFTGARFQGRKELEKLIRTILDALNDYIMTLARQQIQLAFIQSQKEVDDLHQRTREGIETARRNGKQIGQQSGRKLKIRKKSPIQQLILKHSKNFNGSNSDREVIAIINSSINPEDKSKLLHVSLNTYYKYKDELKSINT